MPWDNLTKASEAQSFVPALSPVHSKAMQFATGDYWGPLGDDWAGTQVPLDADNRQVAIEELRRSFTPQPLIEEIVEGYVLGVVGDEPAFEFALSRELARKGDDLGSGPLPQDEQPTEAESNLLREVNSTVGAWWDDRGGHELAQDFAEHLVLAQRAAMRFYVPPGLLNDAGQLRLNRRDWKEALNSIYLEVPPPDTCTLAVDATDKKPCSVYVYQHAKEVDGKKVFVTRVELTFTNDAGETVIRILEGDKLEGEAVQRIGGELYLAEARLRKPIISEALLRTQRALNVVNTMMLHNGNLAGFRERNYINLQRPQREIDDPESPTGKSYVDDDIAVGPGAANIWTGVVYKDIDGNEKLAQGSIVISEPVDPAPLIAAADRFERNAYQAARQMHVLMGGDATASAVSRIQARANFIERLKSLKPKIEGVLRSRLMGAVLLACHLAGDNQTLQSVIDSLRVNVNCRLNPGPLTADERQAVVALFESGIIPLETAQIMLGIDDVEAEAQKLRAEREQSVSLMVKRAQIFKELTDGGAGAESAAKVAGFSEEDAKLLGQGDFIPPTQ
jgi:hypothetical protein